MPGNLRGSLILGFFALGMVLIAPGRALGQECGFCISDQVCDYGATWRNHCIFYPGGQCVNALGCKETGGDEEEVAEADLRTVGGEEGSHVVTRIAGNLFGRWLECNGWITELWVEEEGGRISQTSPSEVDLLFHPKYTEDLDKWSSHSMK